MSRLPSLYIDTTTLPAEVGFETWRRLMAPMYDIRPSAHGRRQPGGSTIVYPLGDLIANRTLFSTQHITRDRRRVETTPDHITFQLWRTGGFSGLVEDTNITCGPGTVALSDRRRTLDLQFAAADTLGLIVPRTLLSGLDLEGRSVRFDPVRNRLLTARLTALYRQLAHTEMAEVPALRTELLAFLRGILDRSQAADVLERRELDRGLFVLAERHIRARMADPDLTPASIALELGVSRSVLYRLFGRLGGVRAYVHEQRLLALHGALADPLETRSVARLSERHGFSTPAYFSRSFRARFGLTPRDWRAAERERVQARWQATPERFIRQFEQLGQRR